MHLHKKRILVVDDEEEIRRGVDRWLHWDGYETLMAEDGEEGLKKATEEHPDAILLDVRMPKRNGMETLAGLKSNRQTGGIPVIMLSASLPDEQLALDAGATFFVQKPYDGRKLLSTIRTAMK